MKVGSGGPRFSILQKRSPDPKGALQPKVAASTGLPTQDTFVPASTSASPAAQSAWRELSGTMEEVVQGGTNIWLGDHGQAVADLQRRLGLSESEQDGFFGPHTQQAVEDFQQAHGIGVTGEVGPETLAALDEPAPEPSGDNRALNAPLMNQHQEGGSYPGGYCAITALRMTLRLEGLDDPGPDAVALERAHPYHQGEGSSGALLAERACELGLAGASFTTSGSLDDVKSALASGHAVPIGGDGPFTGTNQDGSDPWEHNYGGSGHWMLAVGYEAETGRFIVNDPDTGRRLWVSEDDFRQFFSGDTDGNIYMLSYS
jgi:hypothetical protein